MIESKLIVLPRSWSLTKRIIEVSNQISTWLESLDQPTPIMKDRLRLTKCERTDREYRYYYSIIKSKELSATDASSQVTVPDLGASKSLAKDPRIEKPEEVLER